jgi:dTDP-4-dehydrorhamnose 3,5-epimerase
MDMLEGVSLSPLNEIYNKKGNIFHALKSTDETFISFGEAYFSNINYGEIKGWKKHTRMQLNLIVPTGRIKFVLFDDRLFSTTFGKIWEVEIGEFNYQRLTIPPGIFVSFKGISENRNMLLNIASITHDPVESENKNLFEIEYKW